MKKPESMSKVELIARVRDLEDTKQQLFGEINSLREEASQKSEAMQNYLSGRQATVQNLNDKLAREEDEVAWLRSRFPVNPIKTSPEPMYDSGEESPVMRPATPIVKESTEFVLPKDSHLMYNTVELTEAYGSTSTEPPPGMTFLADEPADQPSDRAFWIILMILLALGSLGYIGWAYQVPIAHFFNLLFK